MKRGQAHKELKALPPGACLHGSFWVHFPGWSSTFCDSLGFIGASDFCSLQSAQPVVELVRMLCLHPHNKAPLPCHCLTASKEPLPWKSVQKAENSLNSTQFCFPLLCKGEPPHRTAVLMSFWCAEECPEAGVKQCISQPVSSLGLPLAKGPWSALGR